MCTPLCERLRCYNTAMDGSVYCESHDPEMIRETKIKELERRVEQLEKLIEVLRESGRILP